MANQAAFCVEVLKGTLHPDQHHRAKAEEEITKIVQQPGFLALFFRIVMAEEVPPEIRLAASILMKNEIQTHWSKFSYDKDTDTHQRLPSRYSAEEKQFIRDNIIQSMITVPQVIRSQLGAAFSTIAGDFPDLWPQLLPTLMQNAQSSDPATIYASILCLRLLLQRYQFIRKKKDLLNAVVKETFPTVLRVFEAINPIDNLQSAEIQVLICKLFSTVLSFGVPPSLLEGNTFIEWLKLFMSLYAKKVPLTPNTPYSEIYQSNPWWKAKKWSIQICNKLIRNRPDKEDDASDNFHKEFINHFAVPIQEAILSELSTLQAPGGFLPGRVIAFSILFLQTTILPAITFKALKPNLDLFLQTIVFRILHLNEEDLELFNSDPTEFIRIQHDFIHDDVTPKHVVLDFLYELFTNRSKKHMVSFIQFVAGKLNEYQHSPNKNLPEKYAALSVFCHLAAKLKDMEGFKESLDEFIGVHVLPEISSPNPMVREKACWTFCKFSDVNYRNPDVFVQCLQKTLLCMQDSDLPVSVSAGIGLKFVVNNPIAQPIVLSSLPQILNLYLHLQSEIDSDELISALEYLIQRFQDHIGPHALTLLQNFWKNFLRIIADTDDENTGLASLECLRAILVVLTSIKDRPDIYREAEQILLPSLREAINPGNLEYFEDFTRIISCFACHSETISETLWQFVPLLYQQFDEWALDFLQNILISYDNIITADAKGFAERGYFGLIFKMFAKVMGMGSNELIETLQVSGCQLIELAIQNCLGSANDYVEGILEVSINRMMQPSSGIALPTVLLNIFGNVLLYNPSLTLAILEKHQWTTPLFTTWFSFFDKYQRVYDRKVTILGLSSIFLVPTQNWPLAVQQSAKEIVVSCLRLMHEAEAKRAEKAACQDVKEQISFADESLAQAIRSAITDGNGPSDGNNSDDDLEGPPEFSDPLSQWLEDADLDELEDEDEVITAIDGVDEIAFFYSAMNDFSNREQAAFNSLFATLSQQELNAFAQYQAKANAGR